MGHAHQVKQPPPEFGKYLQIDRSLIPMPPPAGMVERFEAARARVLAMEATAADVALLRGTDAALAGGHREIRRLLLLAEGRGAAP